MVVETEAGKSAKVRNGLIAAISTCLIPPLDPRELTF
jgi:hypothetical protein